jgi:phosphatidylethanolamine-binding protein (PEBP) family uncharacterized protein
MLSVALHIHYVVEDINAGREETEKGKSSQGFKKQSRMAQVLRKDQSGKYYDIFDPLLWP